MRPAGTIIALFSGAAALMHQVLWTRRLVDLLGAGQEASARVLGCFFLGLAAGSAAAVWLRPRVRRPWRWVAGAEAAVALLSLPTLFLPAWTGWIWPALGADALMGAPGAWTKLVVSTLAILPPATAMGMCLPLLGQALLRGQASLDRHGIRLYAINTLGGVLGLAAVALFLLERFGAGGAMFVALATSGPIIGLALLADRGEGGARSPEVLAVAPRPPGWGRALALAFCSGAAVLAFEVAALHLLMLHASLSFHSPAALLLVVIALLAAGAAMVPVLIRRLGSAARLLRCALVLAGVCTIAAPFGFDCARRWIEQGNAPVSFAGWFGEISLLALLSFGPAVCAAALVFPSIFAWLGGPGHDPAGRRWGWLLAANGVGGWIGAELAHRLLLPGLGPQAAIGAIGLAYAAGAVICPGAWRGRFVALGLGLLGAIVVVHAVPALPVIDTHGRLTIVELRTGREGTVAVVDVRDGGRSMLLGNQYVLGSTASRLEQERQAHWPLLLHPAPARVALIGLATGSTAAGALQHEAVRRADVIELSPLVVDLARRHFAEVHRNLFDDPRAHIVIEDGRTFIAASPGVYDVIAGDLFLPWGPGEARLYSVEHFRAVRAALKEGGVYCQWLAMYQLTPAHFFSIAATFQKVFPRTYLVLNDFGAYPAMGLVGFREGDWDWGVVHRRLGELRDAGWDDPLMRDLHAMRVLALGRLAPLEGHRLNTLGNMHIELAAGRLHAVADPARTYLFGRRWVEWLDTIPLDPTL
ncbi:MAG TPA: hypothetical protein PKE12_10535 [Kiritimatiellia bacterium]|nr:hypothetical protein [Kiritimatiellia bacterium]